MSHDRNTSRHSQHSIHSHHSLKGTIDHLTNDAYFGEEIDFFVGLTATALTADQVLKLRSSKHHKAAHLAKAGLGAAVATTAFTLMAREHAAEKTHRAEVKEREIERGRARQRVRDWESYYGNGNGRVESLTDSEDEGRGEGWMVPYGRRAGSVYDAGSRYRRSRGRGPVPPERRAFSHSPARARDGREDSLPRLRGFFEAVRDAFEDRNRK
ncbi:hypothetical protein B0T14DRAFT_86436 [Immersiella caudata]|uniref:Uncharacterized protein n=1 Tax=Immersiella caudata TaxID=314043 RepID=A0AA39XHI4_9PEZI|nr:hypothetical protein B0T14DRAFT_86436 [Immersiella caudata]